MADEKDTRRPAYPPPDYQGYNGHTHQRTPPRQDVQQQGDGRNAYPAPDASRPPVYPQQGPPPAPYPPAPPQWAGHPQQPYPYAPQPHGYEQHPQPYWQGHPSAPQDPYATQRLPPVHALSGYNAPPTAYYPQPAPAPAPRQRTAIACKYCRKRKIRCSGFDSNPDGRCQNCIRFNQQCLFHPVSSQSAFVPASALYGPNAARAPMASQDPNAAPPMLYGAHGQPLGPPAPAPQPQYPYYQAQQPPQGYYPPQPPPGHYGPPPGQYPPGSHPQAPMAQSAMNHPPPQQHDPQSHPPSTNDRSDRGSLKRGLPDDDSHNDAGSATQSPHPNARPRNSIYDRNNSNSFEYSQGQTSPATSTMSYQSYPQGGGYSNGPAQSRGNNSPPTTLTPNSAHSHHSSYNASHDSKTPPPGPVTHNSSGSSRNGMAVHDMLEKPRGLPEQRSKNDNDMLNKLDVKKRESN